MIHIDFTSTVLKINNETPLLFAFLSAIQKYGFIDSCLSEFLFSMLSYEFLSKPCK